MRTIAATLLLHAANAQNVGPGQTCVQGYIMDIFCINRGTLLDNGAVRTLEGPQHHSVHCLVDPGICWQSGFEVLGAPPPGHADASVGRPHQRSIHTPAGAWCRRWDSNPHAPRGNGF